MPPRSRPLSHRRLLLLLLLVLHVPGPVAWAWTLEIKAQEDFKCTAGYGIGWWVAGPMNGASRVTDMRSGNAGENNNECVMLKPSPTPITRLQFDIEYLIGYDLHSGAAPSLSAWVLDKPVSAAASVYVHRALNSFSLRPLLYTCRRRARRQVANRFMRHRR